MTAGLEAHRTAVARFATAAEAVRPDLWSGPNPDGKWTPAEVCEHVAVSYELLARELAGGPAMAIRTSWFQRMVLRLTYMPRILRTGAFPPAVRAPRETRPESGAASPVAGAARLREQAAAFEREWLAARERGGGRVTHPYFGALSLAPALRFCEIHTLHHLRQLPAPPG